MKIQGSALNVALFIIKINLSKNIMAVETKILDGTNPERDRAVQTQVMQEKKFQQEIVEISQHEKKKYQGLKIAGGILAGGAAALAMMSFMPAPDALSEEVTNSAVPLPEDPEKAVNVNDEMSFNEAFTAARDEAGPGGFFMWHGNPYSTYYKEEWNKLTKEEQNEFYNNIVDNNDINVHDHSHVPDSVTIYDEAPESVLVDDSMTFKDAFAVARDEVGPGGVFEWHGKTYSTYTSAEWQSMDHDDRIAYQHSVTNLDAIGDDFVYEHDGVLANSDTLGYSATEEIFLGEQVIQTENGQMVSVGIFENNGVQEIRIDADNNGSYDYLYNPNTDSITSLSTGETVLANVSSTPIGVEDTPVPIGSEEVMIDGHTAWVTTFTDGRIEANVDLDGDGIGDSVMHMTPDGNISLYNNEGALVHQEQINMSDFSTDVPLYPNSDDPSLDPSTDIYGHIATNDDLDYLGRSNDDGMLSYDDIQGGDGNHLASSDLDLNYTNDDYNPYPDSTFDTNADMGDWV